MSTSNQAHVTESSILTSYLLTPSPLSTALPYSTFLNTCVPAGYRAHPHIKHFYRDLQFQRNIDVDAIRENIERECAKSGVLKGQLAQQIRKENEHNQHVKKRKRSNTEREGVRGQVEGDNKSIKSDEDDDDEFDSAVDHKVENVMHNASAHPASKIPQAVQKSSAASHTSSSLLSSMEAAATSLEQEIAQLTSCNSKLLEGMTETIGQLSDLRYGRFARPSGANGEETVEDGVLEALTGLKDAIEKATGHR